MVLEKEKQKVSEGCCSGFASIFKCCEGFFKAKEDEKKPKGEPERK